MIMMRQVEFRVVVTARASDSGSTGNYSDRDSDRLVLLGQAQCQDPAVSTSERLYT